MIKVEWIATLSGIEQTMPIIRSSQYKHSWMKKAAADFKKEGSLTKDALKASLLNMDSKEDVRHTSKCPSLQLWHNTGWIMRLHQDVKIEMINGEQVKWVTPVRDPKQPQLISSHMEGAMAPFFDKWPENTMKKIIKFNLPWMARIPKGYKLLMTHPMWLDDWRFTTCSGIFDPQLGPASVGTIPMLWHSLKGEFLIEAGTPMAQFILIPKEEPDFENINFEDDKNIARERKLNFLILKQRFTTNYSKIKEFWKNYGW